MTKINENLTTMLLLVPAVALVSAAITLDGISNHTRVVAPEIFGVQDYFDKAVDLLIPVFLSIVAAFIIGTFAAMYYPNQDDDNEGRKYQNRTLLQTLGIAVICVLLVGFVPNKKNSALMIAAYVVFYPYVFSLIYRIATHHWPSTARQIHNLSIVGVMIAAVTLVAIQYNLEEKFLKAERLHLNGDQLVIVDKLSAGWLVLQDGRYHLAESKGEFEILASGPEIDLKRSSYFCQWFGGILCFNSAELEE